MSKTYDLPIPDAIGPYLGQCEKADDQPYRVRVVVSSEQLDERDYVIDFAELDELVQEHIIDIIPNVDFANTLSNISCEKIAEWMFYQLQPHTMVTLVELQKNADASVTFSL